MANSKISALTSATTPLAGTEVLPLVQSSTTKKVAVSDLTAGRSVSTGDLYSVKTSAGAVVDVATIQNLSNSANTEAALFFAPTTATGNIRGARISGINDGGNVVGLKFYTGSAGTITSKLEIEGATTGDVTLKTGNLIQGTAAKGVNFTANSAAAGKTSQLLNWYEEGTFTPVVADAATGGNTGTAALAKGRYTRVGRNITVTIAFLDITTTGMTAGNTLYVRALPYASVTDAFVNFIGSQANSQLASTNGAIYPVLGNNSSAIYFLDGIAAGSNNTIKVSGITSGQTDLYITLTYEAA